MKICEVCGKEFVSLSEHATKNSCCSEACRSRKYSTNRVKNNIDKGDFSMYTVRTIRNMGYLVEVTKL